MYELEFYMYELEFIIKYKITKIVFIFYIFKINLLFLTINNI